MTQPPSTLADPETLLRHTEWLRGLAQRLVRDEHSAADVVQQTWLAFLRDPPDPDRSLRGWLARTVRNLALTRQRGEGRRRRHERASPPPEPEPSAERALERAELQQRLLRLVMALREPYRTTVVLRYIDGLKTRQIAERQGVPPGTIDSRLHRALDLLRTHLDHEFGERKAWVVAFLGADLVKFSLPATVGSSWLAKGVVGFVVLVLAGWSVTMLPSSDAEPLQAVGARAESVGEQEPSVLPPTVRDEAPPPLPVPPEEPVAEAVLPSTSRPAPDVDTASSAPRPRSELRQDSLVDLVRGYLQVAAHGEYRKLDKQLQKIHKWMERAPREQTDHPDVLADVPFWRDVLERAAQDPDVPEKPGVTVLDDLVTPTSGRKFRVLVIESSSAEARPVHVVAGADPATEDMRRLWEWSGPGRARTSKNFPAPEDIRLPDQSILIIAVDDADPPREERDLSEMAVLAASRGVTWRLRHDSRRVILDVPDDPSSALDLAARLPGLFDGVFVRDSVSWKDRWVGLRATTSILGWKAVVRGTLKSDLEMRRIPFVSEGLLLNPIQPEGRRYWDPKPPITVEARPRQEDGLWGWWITANPWTVPLEEGQPYLAACLDREYNRVLIVADESVKWVTIYLNDQLLDLDLPVQVLSRRMAPGFELTEGYFEGRTTDYATCFNQRVTRSVVTLLAAEASGSALNPCTPFPVRLQVDLK